MKIRFKKRKEPVNEKPVCEKLTTCSFFSRISQNDKFRIRIYQNNYCEGPHMEKCARLRFYIEENAEPPEDMAPTGIYLTHPKK